MRNPDHNLWGSPTQKPEAAEEITKVFDHLEEQKATIAPSLVFIDPFGFAPTPFSTIERIMRNRRCEVLITFMFEEINRFLRHPDHPMTYDSLFGTEEWREVLPITDPTARRRMIHDIYRDQLVESAGIRYVRSFEMLNKGNRNDYFLFFGSNELLRLEKMKEAMWKVDPSVVRRRTSRGGLKNRGWGLGVRC